MVNNQEVVNILMNFSKFEESQEELIRGTAKLEQMNWSNDTFIVDTVNLRKFQESMPVYCVKPFSHKDQYDLLVEWTK